MPFAAFFVAFLLLLCIPDGSRKLAVCLLLGALAGLCAVHTTSARLERARSNYAGRTVLLTAEVERADSSYFSVNVKPSRQAFNIIFGNVRFDLQINQTFLGGRRRGFTLALCNSFVQKLQVHIIPDSLHMPVLLSAQQTSRTTYLQISQRNPKTAAELCKLSNSFQPL